MEKQGSRLSLHGSRNSLPGYKSPALIPEVSAWRDHGSHHDNDNNNEDEDGNVPEKVMVEKADLADGLLLELEEERSRLYTRYFCLFFTSQLMLRISVHVLYFTVSCIKLIPFTNRCDRLKECLEIERSEREGVETGLGTEVRASALSSYPTLISS